MRESVKSVLARNLNVRAMLKPFASMYCSLVSKDNRMINAYLYDWDRRISADNHLLAAEFIVWPQETGGSEDAQCQI